MSNFVDFVGDRFKLQKIEKISDKHVLAFVEDSYKKGLSVSTIWNTVSAVQFVNQELGGNMKLSDSNRLKEKYVEYQTKNNPGFDKKTTKRIYIANGKNPVWRESEQVKALDLALSMERYDVALSIKFGLELGTRIHETHRQDRAAISSAIKKGSLTTKGKGGFVRNIPIYNNKQIEVLEFAKNLTNDDDPKVFATHDRSITQTMKSVQNWIYNHRDKFSEDDRQLTYHGLRATYAANEYNRIYSETGDRKLALKTVSEQLGHHREWITRVYLSK